MADFETDYLIVGAGAVGLAFADTLIDEDPDCHITFVDKHAKPGGHWNDAYSFVTLHQPSAFYGVPSTEFPSEQVDMHGPNKGLRALASGAEVLAYFERVMNMRLLPTGRVEYYRLSEFKGRNQAGEAKIVSILGGEETTITVRRKLVDATFYQTSVPATHKRAFSEGEGVTTVPPGELPQLWKAPEALPDHYVILGAGKTAMDTAVWLIQAGVDPATISWVRPRESWLWNRIYNQPGEDFIETVVDMQIAIMEAANKSNDGAEMMRILGEKDYYLRIDPDVEPEMFHFATVSQGEVDIMRQIKHVIRNGRVQAIESGKLVFADSEVEVPENSLFIDCTATAVPFGRTKQLKPIFDGETITLQPLHVPLVVFSASICALIEAHYEGDDAKNALATPGPLTDTPATFPYAQFISMMNRGAWSQDARISDWISSSRLDLAGPTIAKLVAENSPKLEAIGAFQQAVMGNMPALAQLGMKAKAIHEAA
ncbi:NAD(P)-binding protein [Altererythrobacter sp. MF3-039]|uniref:NAD(P)-binding protein n=1 Tax=Altererythrobacter sp. MF3-039 TaxID=3252901 RepID=UPI00390C4381